MSLCKHCSRLVSHVCVCGCVLWDVEWGGGKEQKTAPRIYSDVVLCRRFQVRLLPLTPCLRPWFPLCLDFGSSVVRTTVGPSTEFNPLSRTNAP